MIVIPAEIVGFIIGFFTCLALIFIIVYHSYKKDLEMKQQILKDTLNGFTKPLDDNVIEKLKGKDDK